MDMDAESKFEKVNLVLGEMRALSAKPSLTTFKLGLDCVDKPDSKEDAATFLDQTLRYIEGNPIEGVMEFSDKSFFLTAMSIAVKCRNTDLVDRVERAYVSNKEKVTLDAFVGEAKFYHDFLMFKANHLPLEELEKLYKDVVPRVVGAAPGLINQLSERLYGKQRWSFTRRVVEDAISSRQLADYRASTQIRKLLLSVNMGKLTMEEEDEYDILVREMMDYWLELSKFYGKRLQVKMTPGSVSECALLLSRTSNKERCWDLLQVLMDDSAITGEQAFVSEMGYPHPVVINQLFDVALKEGDWENASLCLKVIARYLPNVKLDQYAARIEEKCNLLPLQKRILTNFVRLRA
ncbi:hypothetical protein L596_007253 [Steinernema carpocapsae]|uniref:Uncharacterized protein n=1 Tax=Steinernema carpocapsae TaxID=34508 RepID=A0A4U5P8P3_STECR|nr:hypothetical protein L596_007253 [Steinernema carpocapsae]